MRNLLFSAAFMTLAAVSCVDQSYTIHGRGAAFERPMNSMDPAAIREAEYIRTRRETVGQSLQDPYHGHAMSGGGLRSAVVNLGALQGLAQVKDGKAKAEELSILDRIDFMSAASGGGYTAAWFVSHLDPVTPQILKMRQGQAGADQIDRVNEELIATYANPTIPPRHRRKGLKVIGYDENGYKASSSFNGDLLESNPMVNDNLKEGGEFDSQEGVSFGYGIFHLRGNARHLSDLKWGYGKTIGQWAIRFPFHLAYDVGLHWTPADKFNWHHPVLMYSENLGEIFTRPDHKHELSLRSAPETKRSNSDTLRLREWPLPHHCGENIALEELNPAYSEAPLLILNCRLSNALYHLGEDLPQEAFEFTPLFSGSSELGYVDTKALNMHVAKRNGDTISGSHTFHLFGLIPCGEREKLPLRDAVAASGAALDGSQIPSWVAPFTLLFNLNTRYRMVNYNQTSGSNLFLGGCARFYNFLHEISVGRTFYCERGKASCLTLTDGGHFENLGVYALVRRQLPLITCIDASYDPDQNCDDMQKLFHLLRKQGYQVTPSPSANEKPYPQELLQAWQTKYDNPTEGPRLPLDRFIYRFVISKGDYQSVLLLGKLSFNEESASTLPTDTCALLNRYTQHQAEFPFFSTAQLSFDAYQWEALRILGRHIGLQLGEAAKREMGSGQ